MSVELRQLVQAVGIKRRTAVLIADAGDFLDYEFEVTPEDFLDQAEQDYDTGGKAALLNVVTNSKRAIRCQIDKILRCVGYDTGAMKIKSKVALLKEIGIVAPRILRKVDEPRNSLEHSYKGPTIQEVEDALDIAALFIEATNRSINPIGSWFNMVNSDEYDKSSDRFPNELSFRFDRDKKSFAIDGFRGISQEVVGRRGNLIGSLRVTVQDPVYPAILRLAVVVEREREPKTRAAVQRFFDALEELGNAKSHH